MNDDPDIVLAECGELLCRLADFSTALLEMHAVVRQLQLALSKMAQRIRVSDE